MTTMLEALEAALPFLDSSDSPGGCNGRHKGCGHCRAIAMVRAALSAPVAGEEEIARIIDPYFGHWKMCVERLKAVEHPDVLQRSQLRENLAAHDKALKTARAILQHITPRPLVSASRIREIIDDVDKRGLDREEFARVLANEILASSGPALSQKDGGKE